jgi:hypothetical protein
MGRTTSSLRDTFPREEDLIKDALKWLIKYKGYREDAEGGKSAKAVEYNTTWLKFINRCKDYKDQTKLLTFIKQLDFDEEIKTKLLEILEPDFDLTGEILKTFDGLTNL